MKIMIQFIFRSDLTCTKQRVLLSLSKIINTKVAFLIVKEKSNECASILKPFSGIKLLMLELNICCDKARF